MSKALGTVGFVVALALFALWWGTREKAQPPTAPARPEITAAASPPTPAFVPAEALDAATLTGVPDAASAEPEAPKNRLTVLTGRVVRIGSHAPVAQAAITLHWGGLDLDATSTASDGRFRLEAIVPDPDPDESLSLRLVAVAEGMTTLQAIPAPRGSVASVDVGDLVLEPALTIRGAVRGEDGEPVAGARVIVEPARPDDGVHRAGVWAEAARRQEVVSGADGRFAFTGLPPRSFDLDVRAEGYVSAWLRGRAVADAAWLDVRLRRGQSVRVRVVDMDGAAVIGARVNLYLGYRSTIVGPWKTHVRLDRSTVTDPDGRCVLTGLQDRNYQITAQAHGLAGAATYVLPGWSEALVCLTPGWQSSRYVYEQGPGDSGRGSFLPGERGGTFAWVDWPPEPEEPATPAAPSLAEEPGESEPPEAPEARPVPPADRARLHVTVLSADGVPMPDAYLGFEGPEEDRAITEEDGTELVSLTPGRYAVRVSPIDFGTPAADLHETLDAGGGVESRFVFRLPLVYSVPVEVRSADGASVPSAEIMILRGNKTKRWWTDGAGRILLFAERGQPFSLLSQPDGQPAAFLKDVSLPVSGPVILQAPQPSRLRGRVLGPDGAPVFGAYVEARREGLAPVGVEEWTAWTDDRGGFLLEGPAQARYEVRAHHRAFGAATLHREIGPDGDPVTFRLRPLARLHGRIVDEEGAPIPRAAIELRGAGGGKAYGWVGSDDDGRFEIALPWGETPAELHVTRDRFAPRVVPVPSEPRDVLEVRLATS